MEFPTREGHVGVIIASGGQSQRMGGIDKSFAPLNNFPVVLHSVRPFFESTLFHEIVLVLSKKNLELGNLWVEYLKWGDKLHVCVGGERRQDSVRNGINLLENCSWIAVHDGARPCINSEILKEGLLTAYQSGASVPIVPLTDTIKSLDHSGFVKETLPRELFWRAQTPQIFRRDILLEAHNKIDKTVSDDAQMVELLGYQVMTYSGAHQNIKITSPEDLAIAEVIMNINNKSVE